MFSAIQQAANDRKRRESLRRMLDNIREFERRLEVEGGKLGLYRENLPPVEFEKIKNALKEAEDRAKVYLKDCAEHVGEELSIVFQRSHSLENYFFEVVMGDFGFLAGLVESTPRERLTEIQQYYADLLGHADQRIKDTAHKRLKNLSQ